MTTPTIERQQSSSEKFFRHIAELAKTQVSDSEVYWRLRQDGVAHPDAFRQTAETAAQDKTSELSPADRSLLSVVGNLGVFIQSQNKLDQIESAKQDHYLSTEEYREGRNLKDEHLIPFNHILKEFVNTHPNEELRAVSSALANTYEKLFSRFDCLHPENGAASDIVPSPVVLEKIQASLDGMRHEVAAETLLEAADYSYDRDITTEEDAKGSDLFVYLESGWEGVDIKSTQAGVNRATSKNRFSRAVTTGLLWEDFTGLKGTGRGTLSIPFAVAEEKSGTFVANIYEMVSRNEAQRRSTSRRTGKQSLVHSR